MHFEIIKSVIEKDKIQNENTTYSIRTGNTLRHIIQSPAYYLR